MWPRQKDKTWSQPKTPGQSGVVRYDSRFTTPEDMYFCLSVFDEERNETQQQI
jgi:hypothetical protein